MGKPAENDDPLQAARELAKAHRLFVVDVHDPVVRDGLTRMLPAWVVYRRLGEGCRPQRLGRRRDPAALLRFVRQLVGEPPSQH